MISAGNIACIKDFPYGVTICKEWIVIDLPKVSRWIEWMEKNVSINDWTYLAVANPLHHNFYFRYSEDAVAFRLAC